MPAARIKVLVSLLLLLILLLLSTTTVAVATSGFGDRVEPTVFIEFNATFTCNGTDYALEGWVEVPSMIVFNKTDNMLYCIGCKAQGGSVAPEGYVRIGLKNVSPIIPVSSNMVLHVELDVADTSTGTRLFYLGTELTPHPQSLSQAYWAPYYYDLVNLLRESNGTAVLEVILQPYNVTMYPYTGGQKCSLKSFSGTKEYTFKLPAGMMEEATILAVDMAGNKAVENITGESGWGEKQATTTTITHPSQASNATTRAQAATTITRTVEITLTTCPRESFWASSLSIAAITVSLLAIIVALTGKKRGERKP